MNACMIRGALSAYLLAGCVSLFGAEAFQWDEPTPGQFRLRLGEAPVITCMTAYDDSTPEKREETYKVYTHVYGPGTGDLITKGPGGLYPHHRGIYLGWNHTIVGKDSFDFWHCPTESKVHQRLEGKPLLKNEADSASIQMRVLWNDGAGKPVVTEVRTLTVKCVESGGWTIDVHSELTSNRGEIRLEGDRQHSGLQYRAIQEVAEKQSARYVRPEGFPETPEAFEVDDSGDPPRHINLDWLTMTYETQGHQYTVDYFADPALPRPALYSERPYGRFGSFFKTTLKADAPLVLRYRLRICPGKPEAREAIQKRYQQFASELNTK